MNPNLHHANELNPNFPLIDNYHYQFDIGNRGAPWNFVVDEVTAGYRDRLLLHANLVAYRIVFTITNDRVRPNGQVQHLHAVVDIGRHATRNSTHITDHDIADATARLLEGIESPFMGDLTGCHIEADVTLEWVALRRSNRTRNPPAAFRFAEGTPSTFTVPAVANRQGRNRHGPGIVRGYGEPKIYHDKSSILQFFRHTNALLQVPYRTPYQNCFPMAFMKAQVRSYVLLNNQIQEIVESKACQHPRNFQMKRHACQQRFTLALELGNTRLDFYYDHHLFLFNPLKHTDGKGGYQEEVDPNYRMHWTEAAYLMHVQVEERYGQEIDYQDTEICAPFYADFFGVHIHLYSFLRKGMRFATYAPTTPSLDADHHVHILLDLEQEHAHAITHVRNFFRRETMQSAIKIHQFCDYCTRMGNNNENQEVGLAHCSGCRQSPTPFRNYDMNSVSKNVNPFKEQRLMYRSMNEQGFRWECAICHCKLHSEEASSHLCMIPTPKVPDALPDESLWVYDMEAMQIPTKEYEYKHQVNLVCLQKMYAPEVKHVFFSLDSFIERIIQDPIFDYATFLAHNASGYDAHFLFVYCEENNVQHHIVPAAGSQHRYLSLTVHSLEGKPRRFIDFMSMMPGSLRSIAEAFQLPVQKGDFPHLLNRVETQGYLGPFPPPEAFGLSAVRSDEEAVEFYEWYYLESAKYCNCPGQGLPEVSNLHKE